MELRAQTSSGAGASIDFEAFYRAHAAFAWRSLRRLGVASADLED